VPARQHLISLINRDMLNAALGINLHALFAMRDLEVEAFFGVRGYNIDPSPGDKP
jgi:hypothetical protein